jgi:hypothetical protein
MKETHSQTHHPWSYGLLKNGVSVAPGRSSMIVGEEWLFFRVQGMRLHLYVCGQPVSLAPYLVRRSPNIAGEIEVREYEGAIAGHRFGLYCYDADVDIDLI